MRDWILLCALVGTLWAAGAFVTHFVLLRF